MKRCIVLVLLAFAVTVPAWTAAPHTSCEDTAAIRQLGQDMGDAMIAQDADKLDKMFGEDWVSVGSSGKVSSKASMLADLKSGKGRLTWFDLGPIDVQVYGDTAVAQGYVAEKRMKDDKENYMELVYSDILKRRDGRWVVVHSMGALTK